MEENRQKTERSEVEQTVLDIKKELRASMNGILSAKMREAGMPYKLVFGVELPRLMNIAKEFEPSRPLAQMLWNENIRESKILATLLMPIDEMLPEMADIWVDEVPTDEIAQLAVMNLFSRVPWASEMAFVWMAAEDKMRQLCGFLIMARLLQAGGTLNERSLAELKDQAAAVLPTAGLSLQKAIRAVLNHLEEA